MYLSYKEDGSITSEVIHQEIDQGNWISHQEEVSIVAERIIIENESTNLSISTLSPLVINDNLIIDNYPFEVSSLDTQMDINTLNITSLDNIVSEDKVYISPNGRNIFTVESGLINQYSLLVPFDISSKNAVGIQSNLNFTNFTFQSDGSTVYQANNNTCLEYVVNVPWRIDEPQNRLHRE